MMKSVLLAVVSALVLAACATTPQRTPSPSDPFGMPIDEFQQEAAKLRASLKDGEPRDLDEKEWERLDEILASMDDLVGNATEIDQVPMNNRTRLYELRSSMVNLLVGDVEDEVVCFRQQTTGTRLKDRQRCYTLAQLEAEKFEAETLMRYIDSLPQGMEHDGGF